MRAGCCCFCCCWWCCCCGSKLFTSNSVPIGGVCSGDIDTGTGFVGILNSQLSLCNSFCYFVTSEDIIRSCSDSFHLKYFAIDAKLTEGGFLYIYICIYTHNIWQTSTTKSGIFSHVKVIHFPTEHFIWWRKKKELTTMRFHIFAASATVVQTVLQPAKSINFCGLLYSRLYITLAPRPGSHCKHIKENPSYTYRLLYFIRSFMVQINISIYNKCMHAHHTYTYRT